MGLSLKDELLRRGYVITDSLESGKTRRMFTSPTGASITKINGYYQHPFITEGAKRISKDKSLSYELASRSGITIPSSIRTLDIDEAKKFLLRHGRVVVKPHNGSGGRGLTVDIQTDKVLEQALRQATKNGDAPLVQQQFIGEELRFTILKGKVFSTILRRSPRVVGDGERTIEELIQFENVTRKGLIFPYLTYPQLTELNIGAFLPKDQTIPAANEVIELSKTTMIRNGASFYGVTDRVHQSYTAIVEHLATKLDTELLIVDLMVTDFTSPATDDNYIFLEFNTAPGLVVYSSLRGGDRPDVVREIANMIDNH